MKNYPVIIVILFASFSSKAQKTTSIPFILDDSIKAVQFMTEVQVKDFGKKKIRAGIRTNTVLLYFDSYRITFSPLVRSSTEVLDGLNLRWDLKETPHFYYNWKANHTYKLLISQAVDSAGNFSLYSGYVFLPEEDKWKFISTYRINGRWHHIQQPAFFYSKGNTGITVGQAWIQRSNGTWKNLKGDSLPAPTVNLYNHIDSVEQRRADIKKIEEAIASGKTDVKNNIEGVYYTIMKEGSGRRVSVDDTLTVYYKGYLFRNDSVFDQTKDKPATFPLKRLIKAWQIALPLCNVGGKIKIVIPSDLAYSIRTRSPKIPPNSILVFEIEVLEAK